MYCIQNRIFCGVCNKSPKSDKYPNHLKSQGLIINVLKNQYTNSMILKTLFIKKQMTTELVNNIANEAVYQLYNYKNP